MKIKGVEMKEKKPMVVVLNANGFCRRFSKKVNAKIMEVL